MKKIAYIVAVCASLPVVASQPLLLEQPETAYEKQIRVLREKLSDQIRGLSDLQPIFEECAWGHAIENLEAIAQELTGIYIDSVHFQKIRRAVSIERNKIKNKIMHILLMFVTETHQVVTELDQLAPQEKQDTFVHYEVHYDTVKRLLTNEDGACHALLNAYRGDLCIAQADALLAAIENNITALRQSLV